MKHFLKKLLLLAAVLLVPVSGWGQKRIYTKSVQIQDFKSKTTKVVLDGSPALKASLRQEITSFWTISPYEFCTRSEYEKQKNSPDCYFLHPEVSKGIICLTLSRGGNSSATDAHKLPVTVVALPIAGENDPGGYETVYMPAYITMPQDFVESALSCEYAAYTGIRTICTRRSRNTKVITDPAEAAEAFASQQPDSASQVVITPDGNPKSKPRFTMVIDSSTYALYSYAKH